MLKFRRVGARFFGEPNQKFGAFQIAVVVGGNVRNEIGWMSQTDNAIVDLNVHIFSFLWKTSGNLVGNLVFAVDNINETGKNSRLSTVFQRMKTPF
jgi:hypothetical protein